MDNMMDFLSKFTDWQDILDLLEEGGMTDYARYPQIYFVWNLAKTTNNFEPLLGMLQEAPWIIAEAYKTKRNIPFTPLPYGEELRKIWGLLKLGYVNQNLDWCGLDPLHLTRGLHVVGETGSGKTTAVLRMVDQMLSIPIEERGFNVIIIQILKRDADFLIRKHPNLRIIELPDLRYSMFATEEWDDEEVNINTSISVFSSVNYLLSLTQPILKKTIRNCQGKGKPITFTEINSEIQDAAKSMNLTGTNFKNNADKLKSRLTEFIDTKEVMDTPAGFRIDSFWTKEDICLNLIGYANDYICATSVTDLFLKIQRFNNLKQTLAQGLNTELVMDECRPIFPARKDINDYDPDRQMERFITTARSSGIGRITITQEPQSVANWLTDNSAFFLTFPIAGEAIEHLKLYQNLTDEQLSYIEKLPDKGMGILRARRFDRKYLVQIPNDLKAEPITKEETQRLMRPFIEGLHADVKERIKAIQKMPVKDYTEEYLGKIRDIIHPDTREILETLRDEPFQFKTGLLEKFKGKVSQKKFDASLKFLLENGFIKSVRCFTSEKKKPEFFPLTDKAHDLLETPKHKRKFTDRLFRHSFYCMKVGQWLKRKGYAPKPEYRPAWIDDFFDTRKDGRFIRVLQRVDVYAEQEGRKVAYEITLTFDTLVLNVYKCFTKMEMDELHIVCETKPDKEKAEKIVSSEKQLEIIRQHHGNDIHFRQIAEFL